MSSLKNLVVIVMLGAVSYGVYHAITREPHSTQTLEEASHWSGAPNVQIPGPAAHSQAAQAPSFASGGTSAALQFVPPEVPPTPVDIGAAGTAIPYPSGHDPSGSSIATLQGTITTPFETAKQAVQTKLDQGLLADALLELSTLYSSGQVPREQTAEVRALLDQLAGTVVYSQEHLLEDAYTVRSGDTLEQIADQYQVPWQLLANINGMRDPMHLEPGKQLKVIRGPFDVTIDLVNLELTLSVGRHYAGRFAIGVGEDCPNLEGSYVVSHRAVNPPYHGPDHTMIDAGDPDNPLGEFWIGLGRRIGDAGPIGIHGTNDPRNLHRIGGKGTIRLGARDIQDVFGILSVGSRVVIHR